MQLLPYIPNKYKHNHSRCLYIFTLEFITGSTYIQMPYLPSRKASCFSIASMVGAWLFWAVFPTVLTCGLVAWLCPSAARIIWRSRSIVARISKAGSKLAVVGTGVGVAGTLSNIFSVYNVDIYIRSVSNVSVKTLERRCSTRPACRVYLLLTVGKSEQVYLANLSAMHVYIPVCG